MMRLPRVPDGTLYDPVWYDEHYFSVTPREEYAEVRSKPMKMVM